MPGIIMCEEITCNDERVRRCPMLGHPIQFAYCRTPGVPVPCRKIFDCWWEVFDVTAYMEEWYGEAKIAEIISPSKGKILSLAELIKKAKGEG